MPAVTDNDSKLGDVMRAIDVYPNRVVRAALILAAHTAMRSGVVSSARWEEMDLQATRYARMMAADREMRLSAYDIYRFGAAQLSEISAPSVAKDFFIALFKLHGITA